MIPLALDLFQNLNLREIAYLLALLGETIIIVILMFLRVKEHLEGDSP